ncbi:50S ribosomal protein L17 [Candidatus Uhrbacteria bacterium]|nr:50S ribosomal protein L17 [Candidatus Uhrbacteria bacterium]
MRHRKNKKTFSRHTSARKALVRDLVTSVVTYEKVETTIARAKVTRPALEKLITLSKRGDLAARRALLAYFTTEQPVKKLLEVLGPRYKDRTGGYTRITKLGTRKGDAADLALIELV